MSSDFYNAEMAAKQEQMAKTKDMVRQRAEIIRLLSPTQPAAMAKILEGVESALVVEQNATGQLYRYLRCLFDSVLYLSRQSGSTSTIRYHRRLS